MSAVTISTEAQDPTSHIEASPEITLTVLMQKILDAKKEKKEKSEADRASPWKRCHPLDILNGDLYLIGGDFFNVLFLGFQAVQCFSQAIAALPAVQSCTLVCGVIGGLINIFVGLACLAQGVKELINSHWMNGIRLLFDGVLMVVIGTLMIAGPILVKFASTMAITVALTNPVILPVLFAALSLLITYEILWRLAPMWRGTDLGARLIRRLDQGVSSASEIDEALKICLPSLTDQSMQQLYDSQKNLETRINTLIEGQQGQQPTGISPSISDERIDMSLIDRLRDLVVLIEKNDKAYETIVNMTWGVTVSEGLAAIEKEHKAALKKLCATMEAIEEHVGLESAIEVFQLVIYLIEPESQRSDEVLQTRIAERAGTMRPLLKEWKKAQHVRLLQQILYIGASIISLTALGLAPHIANLLNGIVNTFMTFANLIPLYMDCLWPYNRNVPVVIPGITLQRIIDTSPPATRP